MRIRRFSASAFAGALLCIAHPSDAQSVMRDLEVLSSIPLHVVLVPNPELEFLKRVRADKYAKASFNFFVNDYIVRVLQFPSEELSPDGASHFNASMTHNITLTHTLYYTCRGEYSNGQRRPVFAMSSLAVDGPRRFPIANPCA